MFFFVIEGDNGTGKDTVASKFIKDGFEIITYDKKIRTMEKIAKKEVGKNRVLKFMAYNKAESDLIKEKRNYKNVLLIRYFVSTLAAGYADGIFTYKDTIDILKNTYPKFEKPDAIIRLKCDYQERVNRIGNRNSKEYDDKTYRRNVRYRWITDKIKENIDVNWIDIDTSNKSIAQIYTEINNGINDIITKNNTNIDIEKE